MKNTENAAKPMSAIVYRHVCPWRLSTRPAQTSFRSDRSSSSAFMPSWNHIDPQDGSPNRAPESNSRTQDPRSDLRLRFSRIENRCPAVQPLARGARRCLVYPLPVRSDFGLRYISTRGAAPALGFDDVLLTGLARDGGLYVPESWPRLSPAEIAGAASLPYAELAARISTLFAGDSLAEPLR